MLNLFTTPLSVVIRCSFVEESVTKNGRHTDVFCICPEVVGAPSISAQGSKAGNKV